MVWLEPYFLKPVQKFGFLVDFKFQVNDGEPFSKRVQQLSLSLDKNGKSNTNSYVDRYKKIGDFVQKFHHQLFPLSYLNANIAVEQILLSVDSDLLKAKKYEFGNKATDQSQFLGVKNKGPLVPADQSTKIVFVYREQDKSFSHDLYRALRGDSFAKWLFINL